MTTEDSGLQEKDGPTGEQLREHRELTAEIDRVKKGLLASDAQNALKSCPFCGNANVDLYRETPTAYWQVLCYKCDQSGKTQLDAITEWNKRAATSIPDTSTALDAGEVSSCCKCRVRVHSSDEGTSYYTCTNCGQACDATSPAAVTGEWTCVKDQPALPHRRIWQGDQHIGNATRMSDARAICDAHNAALAQLTARAEAAEAKLKVLEERI